MTEYTSRILKYEKRDPSIALVRARELTGLDLVSARETSAHDGYSYHEMEEKSQSKSHESVRNEGIDFFCSRGYQVFPEGIGIRGTYTLADFLAIRGNRIVFVEVLSDKNVKEETLKRKAQLQQHGELCFILFAGTKNSDEPNLIAVKRSIESWADVLYCRLNRYKGNRIEPNYKATVAYDTTRRDGIKVSLGFERYGRKVGISVKFLTHLYRDSAEFPRACSPYPVGALSYCYEEIFHQLFVDLGQRIGGKIKLSARRPNVTSFRAMRRKSGLKMTNERGSVSVRLKSEYRGVRLEEDDRWTYDPSTRDLPPDDIFGVFLFEQTGPQSLRNLVVIMREHGMTLQYEQEQYAQSLQLLAK